MANREKPFAIRHSLLAGPGLVLSPGIAHVTKSENDNDRC
jgi:hypothetical protein